MKQCLICLRQLAELTTHQGLAVDVAALIDALSPGKPCVLIGQDWGAAIGYGVLAAYPEKVSRAALLAVPHTVVNALLLDWLRR